MRLRVSLTALVVAASFIAGAAQAGTIGSTYDVSVYTTPGNQFTFNNSGYAGSAGDGEVARDYLQFALPQTPDTYVSAATLTLHYAYAYQNAAFPLSLYATTSNWDSNITWANQPGFGTTLATFNPTTNNSSYTFDVTSFVNSQFTLTGTSSIIIAAATEYFTNSTPNSWRYFNAGTASLDYTLSSTAVPEPASLMLLATGLVTAKALRRRRRAAGQPG